MDAQIDCSTISTLEEVIGMVGGDLPSQRGEKGKGCCDEDGGSMTPAEAVDFGICAICLDRILPHETALVKGCEHAYCVTCILRWATYKEKPLCPQCKHPFDFLNVHRSLDGRIYDYMFEESVCLLLRASWFVAVPTPIDAHVDAYEELYDYLQYEDEVDDLDEGYYVNSLSNIRIGNRRWGDNGYVRSGRKEARPIIRQFMDVDDDAGPSRAPKKKESSKDGTGRRAKRALKREAADKAAAAKHQQHLQRLGRK